MSRKRGLIIRAFYRSLFMDTAGSSETKTPSVRTAKIRILLPKILNTGLTSVQQVLESIHLKRQTMLTEMMLDVG